jgi:Spy/CpxP family protein refolding chaperone
MTRSRLGAAGLLIVTFVLGALVGGAATSLADREGHRTRGNHPRPSYVERLGADLDLSEAQKDSVRAVLDRHQPAMDSLWESIRPQFQSERQSIRTQINAFLTPDQQARYATLQRQDSLRRTERDRSRNGRR